MDSTYRVFTVPHQREVVVADARWAGVFLPNVAKRPSIFAWSLLLNAALTCGVAMGLATHARKPGIIFANLEHIHLIAPPPPPKPQVIKHSIAAHNYPVSIVEPKKAASIKWGELPKPRVHAKPAKTLQALKGIGGVMGGTSLGGLISVPGPAAPPKPTELPMPIIQHPSCSGKLTSFSNPKAWNAYMPSYAAVVFEISETGRLSNIEIFYPDPQPPPFVASLVTSHLITMLSTARCKPFEVDGKKSVSMGQLDISIGHGVFAQERTWKQTW